MKALLWGLTAGLLVKLVFSMVLTHWFPVPHPERTTWNTAKEDALARAAAAEERASQ